VDDYPQDDQLVEVARAAPNLLGWSKRKKPGIDLPGFFIERKPGFGIPLRVILRGRNPLP
jgi:hypothetical protein